MNQIDSRKQIANLPFLDSAGYNFPAQSPGGSLTSGITNTITLSPVPDGVNGSNSNHYLYISGGSGTAEAVLITGGTAVSGASSGTITFTPANSHSGAWTIQSATAGIQEAIWSLDAKGGTVLIPAGEHILYATIHIGNGTVSAQSSRNGVVLQGVTSGCSDTVGARQGATELHWYGANGGTMLSINGPIINPKVMDIMFDGAPSSTIAAKALYSIHAYGYRYQNLLTTKVSGFAYTITAWGPQTAGFAAGSSGICDTVSTLSLQTTGSGISVGGDEFQGPPDNYLDVAQAIFFNCHLQVGSSGTGVQLQYVDSSKFYFCVTENGLYGLKVLNVTGDANNFPTSMGFDQCYFGGTTSVSVPANWHPTQASDIYGGLLFTPFCLESGTIPASDGVYGYTDSYEHFNFKYYLKEVTLADGDNHNVDIGVASCIRVTGPTNAYAITGFTGGRNGRVLTVLANAGNVLTIKNNTGSTSGNRIAVPGGSNFALSNGVACATFVYSNSDSTWYFVSGK